MAERVDFATLFKTHYSRVYRYVRYRVDDDMAAEDLTSEIFERAFRARDRYDPARAAFSTWIGQIAHNHVTNHLVTKARRAESRLDDAESYTTSDAPPEAQVIQKEMLQRLFDCLKSLSDRERQIVALRFGSETRNKDIATILELKEHSVSVMLMRALERLRGCQEA